MKPSCKSIKGFGLANVDMEPEMFPNLMEYQFILTPTYETLIHIVLDLKPSMFDLEIYGNPFMLYLD